MSDSDDVEGRPAIPPKPIPPLDRFIREGQVPPPGTLGSPFKKGATATERIPDNSTAVKQPDAGFTEAREARIDPDEFMRRHIEVLDQLKVITEARNGAIKIIEEKRERIRELESRDQELSSRLEKVERRLRVREIELERIRTTLYRDRVDEFDKVVRDGSRQDRIRHLERELQEVRQLNLLTMLKLVPEFDELMEKYPGFNRAMSEAKTRLEENSRRLEEVDEDEQ